MAWVYCENDLIANTKELRTDTTRPRSMKTLFDKRYKSFKPPGNSDGYSRLSRIFWRACDIRSNTASNFGDREATELIYPNVASQSVNLSDITKSVSQPNAVRMESSQPGSSHQPGSSQPCPYSPDLYHLPKLEPLRYQRRYCETSRQPNYSPASSIHTTRFQMMHDFPETAAEAGERNKTPENVSNSMRFQTAHDSSAGPAEADERVRTPENVSNLTRFQTAHDLPGGGAAKAGERNRTENV